MSKRKPTSSQLGIDRYFCKSRRTESPVDEGEKTANDGNQQTLVIQQHVLMKVTKQPKQGVTNPHNKTDKFSGHLTDSSHMLLKRTGSQGTIRVL